MNGYTIVDNLKIEDNITFIRINPTDIALTLKEVFISLSSLSWINNFDKEYTKQSFKVRADATVKYISDNIIRENDDEITSNSAEYVISELSRKSLITELNYSDIPLGELIKEQKSGNPGFDFYSENGTNILLFGEAKYIASRNAYGSAFKQIVRFEKEKRDIADINDIEKFCSNKSLNNFTKNKKGFVAGFASKKTPTDKLIDNIKKNTNYNIIKKFDELICVAVNL